MTDIIELIRADHLHIMQWAARLGELSRQDSDRAARPELVTTWQTLAALIDLHMQADEEICGPAVFGTGPGGRALARQTRGAHEDIRELIRETGLQPPGSPQWWHLARTALAAWAVHRDHDEHGPLAQARRRADPALRKRLARQWRAFADAQVRDRYPRAPAQIPTHQLRADGRAPAAVPRMADAAFGPLACTCRACTRTLDWVLFRQRQALRQRPAAARAIRAGPGMPGLLSARASGCPAGPAASSGCGKDRASGPQGTRTARRTGAP